MKKFKISVMCASYETIPTVMQVLQDVGCERIRDVSDSSISADITVRWDATIHPPHPLGVADCLP